MKRIKVVVGITGASGSLYAKVLLEKLRHLSGGPPEVGVVMTENARKVWEWELGNRDFEKIPFPQFNDDDFHAPFASGSAQYGIMIICPCSMGTLGRLAHGVSDSLLTRAADVMLKERRKLILVPRDAPYNLIHIRNMQIITEAGGIICPASPSFYSKPQGMEALAATVVDRVLDLAGFDVKSFRWGGKGM